MMKSLMLTLLLTVSLCHLAQATPVKFTPFVKHLNGIEVKRDSLGIVTVDGKPAAQDEVTEKATAYSQGIFTVIIYKSGKVALMNQGQFIGYLK